MFVNEETYIMKNWKFKQLERIINSLTNNQDSSVYYKVLEVFYSGEVYKVQVTDAFLSLYKKLFYSNLFAAVFVARRLAEILYDEQGADILSSRLHKNRFTYGAKQVLSVPCEDRLTEALKLLGVQYRTDSDIY